MHFWYVWAVPEPKFVLESSIRVVVIVLSLLVVDVHEAALDLLDSNTNMGCSILK